MPSDWLPIELSIVQETIPADQPANCIIGPRVPFTLGFQVVIGCVNRYSVNPLIHAG